jgi:hypothetical protein
MSDDLLERLGQYCKPGRGDDHPQAVACREALERIEALTAELGQAWKMVAEADTRLGQALGNTLQDKADNARLRAELTKAADSLDWADAHLEDAGVVSANIRYGARDARAALNAGKADIRTCRQERDEEFLKLHPEDE